MPSNLATVVAAFRLPSSRDESVGVYCTKKRKAISLSFWCKVYHAPVFLCCTFERDRWSQKGTRRQKPLEARGRVGAILTAVASPGCPQCTRHPLNHGKHVTHILQNVHGLKENIIMKVYLQTISMSTANTPHNCVMVRSPYHKIRRFNIENVTWLLWSDADVFLFNLLFISQQGLLSLAGVVWFSTNFKGGCRDLYSWVISKRFLRIIAVTFQNGKMYIYIYIYRSLLTPCAHCDHSYSLSSSVPSSTLAFISFLYGLLPIIWPAS